MSDTKQIEIIEGFVVFSDLKKFSSLKEQDLKKFFEIVLPQLTSRLESHKKHTTEWNTWGDAIIAVFEYDYRSTPGKYPVDFALEYREFFRGFNFEAHDMPRLQPRIACHFGNFYKSTADNDIWGGAKVIGENINTAARIEPVTTAGEIFITKEFRDALNLNSLNYVEFEELGDIALAKNAGIKEMYRLKKTGEPQYATNKILKQDLSKEFPEPPGITDSEKELISTFEEITDKDKFLNKFDTRIENNITDYTGCFLLKIAKMLKRISLYEKAVLVCEKLEEYSFEVPRTSDDSKINIHPYKSDIELLKIKANSLTRLGEYEIAANIVYNIWKGGAKNSDTLSMLAAQYKRQAIYGRRKSIEKEKIDVDLLRRACSLYTEAFRLNRDDFYPAINLAYLYKMLYAFSREKDDSKGMQIAGDIINTWSSEEDKDWWLSSTIAEAYLIQEDIETSLKIFKDALLKNNPDKFELQSVIEQIEIFGEVIGSTQPYEEILNLLKRNLI